MAGVHPHAAWLDAMGVDRWVRRSAPAEPAESTPYDSAVSWQAVVDSPVLAVLSCSPLDGASTDVLDRMLAAIQVSRLDCAIGLVSAPNDLLSVTQHTLLILSSEGDEAGWRDALAGRGGHTEIIAHPDRFSADPALKRPAWEALKRLERTLNAG